MKTLMFITFIATSCLIAGCDRPATTAPVQEALSVRDQKPITEVGISGDEISTGAESRESTVSEGNELKKVNAGGEETTSANIGYQAVKLAAEKQANGEIGIENLKHLVALLPRLRSDPLFWVVILNIPDKQIGPFREQVLSALKALTPTASQTDNAILRKAYNSVEHLSDTEIAKIAWTQFQLAPEYRFPDKPSDDAWPTRSPETTEHLEHGLQGILAKATLKSADEQILKDYREMIKSGNSRVQRVMIWALGQYGKIEDFDMLMSLMDKIPDEGTKDTLVRAMNRIVQNPYVGGVRANPDDAKNAAEEASKRYQQLVNRELVVKRNFFYD